jgi:hypothetical protein
MSPLKGSLIAKITLGSIEIRLVAKKLLKRDMRYDLRSLEGPVERQLAAVLTDEMRMIQSCAQLPQPGILPKSRSFKCSYVALSCYRHAS